MLAQWTGEVVGKMHIYGVQAKQLADAAGMHEKYLSAILNCKRTSDKARKRIEDALDRIVLECGGER